MHKIEQICHHRSQFSRISHLTPQRRRLVEDIFIIAPIRSENGHVVLRGMINLYLQDTEVAFFPGLNLAKCCYVAERSPKIDRFVTSPFYARRAVQKPT